jgi:transcriptional regulator
MYIPKHFEVTDKEEIFAFIKANAFGQFVSSVEGRLFSTNIPFLISDDHSKLIGHLAKQNPQWKNLEGQEVLATFLGPHDYVSPSWYKSPGVPTWNYQSVHVYGHCKRIHEPEQLKHIVNTLTNKYESTRKEPWQITYNESMLQKIVGLEIQITEIQCKYKLSQNRSNEDQAQVSNELENNGNIQLSNAMKHNEL